MSTTHHPTESNIVVFDNPEFGSVRIVLDDDGEPWFVAKDVCESLGYIWNGAPRIAHVPEEWRGITSVVTPSGEQEMHVLSEQGLYFFLGRSDKPGALPYQKMIAGDVMPSIRKHGGYLTPAKIEEALLNPDTLIRLATDLKTERARRQIAEAERDKAIRDKSRIGSNREATSMAATSAANRKVRALEDELGRGRTWKAASAIDWLDEEFDLSQPGTSGQIGRELSKLTRESGYETREVDHPRFGKVKTYHSDMINLFRLKLRTNPALLRKYRISSEPAKDNGDAA